MFCMDVFLHKLVYEGIKRSEWKNFLREGEDMKKIWKEDCGISAGSGSGSDCGVSGFCSQQDSGRKDIPDHRQHCGT